MESLKSRKRRRPAGQRPAFWRSRNRGPVRSRAQSLVEFALVAPLFLLILFGVIEYALINASIGAFNFAAKEGARYEAIIGNGQPPLGFASIDQYIVNQVILPQVAGVVMAQAQAVVVYRATESGDCDGSGSITNQPLPNCVNEDVLQPNGSGTWVYTQSTWLTSSAVGRNDQLSNADYLGVFISYKYTYLTAFFAITSPTITLSAISVQRIEPQQYGDSGQSQPVAHVGGGAQWASNPFPALLDLVGFAVILPRRSYIFLTGGRA